MHITQIKMDDDQQVAVLLQLNINDNNIIHWENDLSPEADNISINEISGSAGKNQGDSGKDIRECLLEKDFEFLKKHAEDADPEFLFSLLSSQADNPDRLKTVMCEILNIPNAQELIQEFQRKAIRAGEKRLNQDADPNPEEMKKQRVQETESYLKQIRDMFPDADGLFLISECQQLESWDDCSRFINTVMLSGVYPKKNAVEYASNPDEHYRVANAVNDSEYRLVDLPGSDDEASSSDMKSRKKENCSNRNTQNSDASEIEVIDLASDNTESYEIPDDSDLKDLYQANFSREVATIREDLQPGFSGSGLGFMEEIEHLLQAKFGESSNSFSNSGSNPPSNCDSKPVSNLDSNTASNSYSNADPNPASNYDSNAALNYGSNSTSNYNSHSHSHSPVTSESGRRTISSRSSTQGDAPDVPEKSLAEIIEEKRHGGRYSTYPNYSKDLSKPSTSKAEEDWEWSAETSEIQEDGNTEVSSGATAKSLEMGDAAYEVNEDLQVTNEEWLSEQTANLIRIFPNVDPSYLREEVERMNGSAEAINEFVESKLEVNDMPTRAEYEEKKEMEELQNRYTKNFSIEDFLKAVPDPWVYFNDDNRNCAKYKCHSLCYLKSIFRKHYVRQIIDTFNRNNCNLFKSYQCLKNEKMRLRGSRRSEFECNNKRPMTIDIQFLQEVAFIENEDKISEYLANQKRARELKFEEAKMNGSLLECQCCFDTEVMVEDIVYCPRDHAFCKECIVKFVEVEMGSGRCQFECLVDCDQKFTLASLQNALKPELFSKIIQANQIEEIRAAEIEDLVQCPFCNYATIMPPEEKVMTCLNPECLKESCRSCKELNHIPLRCEEVEKSEEVKMRTYIENKMTEALVRTCYKCQKKFVKEDGCNKMTCTCGAKMCYVCRKPVTDYSHFNGQGGTEYYKCPLYSQNDELHVDLVRRIGEEAKAEILQANPQKKLIHDPTLIMPERTHDAPMPGVNNGIALDVGLRAIRENDLEVVEVEEHRRRTVGDLPRDRRHEHNPNNNRHHRPEVESDIDDSDEDEAPNQHHNHHNHHHHHHLHRPRHQLHHRHHHQQNPLRYRDQYAVDLARRGLNRHSHRY